MKLKCILFVLPMIFSFSSIAAYEECEINNGSIGFCGSWAQKENYPVKQSDGRYTDCNISNGSVEFCGAWSQAQDFPIKQESGSYESCSISNGSVSFCGAWYNGSAAIER